MSKAAELAKAGETLTNQPSGRKNIVTNGAMQVAQRSASVTGLGAASGYFTCDRWKLGVSGTAGRLTMAQVADGPSGFANCMKLTCTTADASIAAGEILNIVQQFEGQDVQSIGKGETGAKQVTASFYVKGNATATYLVELEDIDNSRTNGKLFAVTTDWVRHEITFEADVDDGSSPLDDDNASSLALTFYLHGGSNFTSGTLASGWENSTAANRLAGIDSFFSSTDRTLFITGVQLEIGSKATNFEHRSFGEELLLCERYCTVYNNAGEGEILMSSAQVDSANRAELTLLYPKKRAEPSVTVVNPANFKVLTAANTGVACTGFSGVLVGSTPVAAIMFWTVSSGVATNNLNGVIQQLFIFQNTGSITIDAEL